MGELIEKGKAFLSENPSYAWILVILLGVFVIIGAIFNWAILFEEDGRIWSLAAIKNMMGETAARIAAGLIGVVIAAAGLLLLLVSKH